MPVVKHKASPIFSSGPRKRLIAFGWYGGKYSHLDWLLPYLPPCHHYCEPFGGSGAVLINREPSPVETYNDLDGEVVNFFRVLRNNPDELIRQIALTPFSREEFAIACDIDVSQSDIERARRFYVRARQVRTGLAQTASLGRWANCKNTSRAGMSGVISRWMGGVAQLEDGLLYLTVHGQGGEPLTFTLRDREGRDFIVDQRLVMQDQTLLGSRKEPYLLTVGGQEDGVRVALGSKIVSVQYYSVDGRRLSAPAKGISIQKTIYEGGQSSTHKIMR